MRAVIVVIILAGAAIAGAALIDQAVSTPSLSLGPSTSLTGNPVKIQLVTQGLLLKGSFLQLKSVSFHPQSDSADVQSVPVTNGLSATHIFNHPGRYVVSADYVNAGGHGIVTSVLTVLPSNFTAGGLNYGAQANYTASNGMFSASNPYGIISIPIGSSAAGSTLSVISVGLHLNAWLNSSVSSGNFRTVDGSGTPVSAYAINSTFDLQGNGYANVLAGSLGLNLSASLQLRGNSSLYNSVAGNYTVAQYNNLTARLTVGYLGSSINLLPDASGEIDSFASVSPGSRFSLLFSAIGNNGTFDMPAQQLAKYVSGLPRTLQLNLDGKYGSYDWRTAAYSPSTGMSSLVVNFTQPDLNLTNSITLSSDSGFPAGYGLTGGLSLNGTHALVTLQFNRNAVTSGTSVVGTPARPGNRQYAIGIYSAWNQGPLPPVNDSTILSFSMQSALDYGINKTGISGYLKSYSNAFIISATYNFTVPGWSMTFYSPAGMSYRLNVTDINGTFEAAGSQFSGSLTYAAPFGNSILELQSAIGIALNSSYSHFLAGSNGKPDLRTLTFALQSPCIPQITLFLPPVLNYVPFAYTLTSSGGAVLAIDAGNGQLMYFDSFPL